MKTRTKIVITIEIDTDENPLSDLVILAVLSTYAEKVIVTAEETLDAGRVGNYTTLSDSTKITHNMAFREVSVDDILVPDSEDSDGPAM